MCSPSSLRVDPRGGRKKSEKFFPLGWFFFLYFLAWQSFALVRVATNGWMIFHRALLAIRFSCGVRKSFACVSFIIIKMSDFIII